MLNIKKLLKGLRILNDVDQSKAVEITVDNLAVTNTKTTLVAQQTANRTIILPDDSAVLVGDDTTQSITNKQVSLSNTSDNKMLISEASTHKIVDSLLTHIDNAGVAEISNADAIKLSAPNTKEIILEGKAVRLPNVAFAPASPPTGFVGDIVYNTTTDTIWNYTSIGYVELIGDSGANKHLSNLLSPTSINQDLLPDASGKDLGSPALRWDANLDIADVNTLTVNTLLTSDGPTNLNDTVTINADVTVNGNVSINGTFTTINTAILDVTDANVTVNKGGTDITAEGAGLTVERTGTNGSLIYKDTAASKFKIGALGSESEIITAETDQLISGQKTIQNLLNLPSVDNSTTNTSLALSGASVTRLTGVKPTLNEITGLSDGSFGMLINTSATDISIVNEDVGVTAANRITTNSGANYILKQNQSVIYYRDSVSQRTRLSWVNPQFSEETLEFKLNGSYYDPADVFPIDAIDGYTVVPYDMIITNVFLYNIKAGEGGASRFRLYSKAFGAGSFTNLFTTDPSIAFTAGDSQWIGVGDTVTGCTAPILNVSSQFIAKKSVLKCDVIQLQNGTTILPEDCGLVVHYLKL
jgi:hypothetical protein